MSRSSWRRPLVGLSAVAAMTATVLGVGTLGTAGASTTPTPSATATPGPTTNIQILSFNDFHGAFDPHATRGGAAAKLSTLVQQQKATNPTGTITAGAGDLIGATPLLSAAFHDEPTIEAMNILGMDVTSVGNHEFDEGRIELTRMRYGSQAGGNGCHPTDGCGDGDPYGGSGFPYLAANVVDQATGRPIFPATHVITKDGVKVGFIGMTLEATPEIVSPSGVAGLTFLDEADTANKYTAELKAQGVETIVVLVHEGGAQSPSSSGANSCSGLSGAITGIVPRMDAEIDVVVSGHTHQAYNCVLNNKIVTSAGSSGQFLTDIDLVVSKTTGDVVSGSANNIAVANSTSDDQCIVNLLAPYRTAVAPIQNRVIGKVTADITRTINAAGESALGNVIADGQYEATSAADKGGAVAAFMNPGGIRTDVTYTASGSEGDGNVTFGEMFQVQPFGNNLVTLTLTGAQIDTMLEQQFDNPGAGQNRILQVSRTVTYTWDAAAPKGSKVDIASIKINGTPIVSTQSYRITVNSFLADGGDGFAVLREGTNRLGGAVDTDAFEAYFKAHGDVSPPALNRITKVGEATPTPTPTPTATTTPTSSPTATTTPTPAPTPTPFIRDCPSELAAQGGSAASVTLTTNASTITAGNRPTLSGVVKDALGQPVAGTQLTLWSKAYGGAWQASTAPVVTNASGAFSVLVAPAEQTAYAVRANTLRQSATLTVLVHRRVEILAPLHNATVSDPVRIVAQMTPAEMLNVGIGRVLSGKFGYLAQGATASNGRLDVVRDLPAGTYALVVYTSARQGVLAGSRSVMITVR